MADADRPHRRTAAAVALAATLLYALLPVRMLSSDNVAHLMTTESLLEGSAGLLDGVVPRFAARGLPTRVYLLPSRLGGWVAPYAPGVALLLAPPAAAALAAGAPPRWVYGTGLAHLAAAAAMGLAVGWLWLAARRLAGRAPAALAAAALAVASPALGLLSREPWQQTALAAVGAAMLALAARGRPRPGRWTALGALAGLAVLVRPTAAAYALPWAVWAAASGRRGLLAFVLPAAGGAGALGAYTWLHFGAPWRFGQLLLALGRLGPGGIAAPDPLAAAAGLLVSPGAGLLVYFPAAALAVLAAPRRAGPPPATALARISWATPLLALLAACWYREWWGGWGYGPRYLADATPHLALLAALGLERARRTGHATWRRARATALALLLAGLAVNAAGRLVEPYDPGGWPAVHDVDRHPEALWSLADAPPLHNLRTWWRGRAGRR